MNTIITMIMISSTIFSQASIDKNCKNKSCKSLPQISVENCKYLRKASEDKKNKSLVIAKEIFLIEAGLEIPDKMRGMTLAAACLESGFNPSAKGDKKFSKSKKKPMAIGILQLWPFYEKTYKTNRRDPKSSAKGWLLHIKRMVPKVRRQCRYRSVRKVWIAAWVTGIRYRKPGGRCKERPLHLRYFLKIRKIYESQFKKSKTVREK